MTSRLNPFPDTVFKQPGRLLHIANLVGNNATKRAVKFFCDEEKNTSTMEMKPNEWIYRILGPRTDGYACEINGIRVASVGQRTHISFLGNSTTYLLVALQPVSETCLAVALVRHGSLSTYASSEYTRSFLKRLSDKTKLHVQYNDAKRLLQQVLQSTNEGSVNENVARSMSAYAVKKEPIPPSQWVRVDEFVLTK